MVVSVWNFTGSVDIDKDGSWVGIEDQQHKTERHPSLVSRFGEFTFTLFSVSLFVRKKIFNAQSCHL